ncbi:MAG TPA: RHS repeat-associated core domain-containing protein [Tepidisphaeraceae bacterium]|nr:RHS repeat-associated core domain-containing protein [Tepidisphaeraceae bacterium]
MLLRKASRRARPSACHAVEPLESRTLLVGYHFTWVGGSGDWSDASHWTSNAPDPIQRPLPTGEDTVTLNASGETVTATFANMLTGVIDANLRLSNSIFTVYGTGLTINGTLTFAGGGGQNQLRFLRPATLDGSGTVTFTSSGGQLVAQGPNNLTLTIGGGLTIRNGTSTGTFTGTNIVSFADIIVEGAHPNGLAFDGGRFTNLGTIDVNGSRLQLDGPDWTNGGVINLNAGRLDLGGTYRQSDLGRHTRAGGSIVAGGTLVGDLTLDERTGSWNSGTVTLTGGRLTTSGGATFNASGAGTGFNNYTLGSDLYLPAGGRISVRNALTLDGATLRLNGGEILFDSFRTSLRGSGQVLFNGGTFTVFGNGGDQLTVDPGVELRVDGGNGFITSNTAGQRVVLNGPVTVASSGNGLSLLVPETELAGQMNIVSGGGLEVFRTLNVRPSGGITNGPRSSVNLSQEGRILNTATGPTAFALRGTTFMNVGSAAQPAALEAAGEDRGPVPGGYRENFAMGVLRINNGHFVRLVNSADNSPGAAEALYVDSLVVPNAATLDLNGLNLYARAFERTGTGAVLNGTVTVLPDGGPIAWSVPTSGRVSDPGQRDDWTFFGRAGQTVSAVLNPSANPTPSSPAAVGPQLVLARLALLSPAGQELAAAQTAAAGGFNTLPNVVLPADGTYTLRAQASAADPNRTGVYNLTLYDVTSETRSLLLNEVAHGAIETPFASDRWTFALSAGQQVQFDLLTATTSNLRYTLEGPEGFVAFSNLAGDSGLITVPPGRGGDYVLTARGQTDQTGAYSFLVRDGSVTTLELGTTFAGVLPGSGAPRWFKATLPTPGQLLVTLDDSTDADRNQLYLRRGAPPTREVFDYRFASYDADEQLFVPDATAGDWYVLVFAGHVPNPSSYTLRAEYSDLRVGSITPDRYGVGHTMTMTLTGGGFGPGTVVRLISGATTIDAATVEADSFTQATATLNLGGAPQGVYDVRVERGAAAFTLPRAFTALPDAPARLEMRLVMPSRFTQSSVATGSIEYANTGNIAIDAPLMILQSGDPQGDQFPILSLDLARTVENFWSSPLPPGTSHRVMVLGSGAVPGVLNPGERMSVPFNYLGEKPPIRDSDNLLQLELLCVEGDGDGAPAMGPLPASEVTPAGESHAPVDWAGLKNALRPPGVPAAIWDRVYPQITGPLDTAADFVDALVADAKYLGRIGVRVVDADELWNFEVLEALGSFTAFRTLASSVDSQLPAPTEPLTFSRSFGDGVISRNVDGPFGFGWSVPWFAKLSRGPNNDVITIHSSGGGQRVFVRDGRGSTPLSPSATYFSAAGDPSRLRRVSSDVYELRDVGGTVTRFRADGKIDYVQDANANRTTAAYGTGGRLATLTHSSGATITLQYNAAGRISRLTDSLGRSITYTYDDSGDHLMTAAGGDGSAVSYTYEANSPDVMRRHALLSEQSGGTTQVYTYDARGRVASSFVAGGGQSVSIGYSFGRVSMTDATATGHLFFDHRLQLARVTNALGYSSRMAYDANGRLTTVTLPDGARQSYTWCDCGSLMSATNELGEVVRFTRDPVTRKVTSITDPMGNVTRMTYDALGNQLSMIYANGSSESAGNYTASGLPQAFTDRRGKTSTYVYNPAGQVTRRTAPDGTVTDYAYDSRGRLTTVTQGGQVTRRAYDTAVDGDRLKRITYPNGRFIEYDYDDFGRVTAERDHSGFTTRYEYDAAGRLLRARDAAGAVLVGYAYDAADRLSRIDNGNGTFTTYGYDAAGNVLSIENWRSAGVVNSRFAYTYDARGRRTTAAVPDGTWTYRYDPAGQLTGAAFGSTSPQIPDQNIQIAYDVAGNRTFATVNGVLHDYAANALNQYTRVDGVNYVYDPGGNLLSDGVRQYVYDDFNRLVEVRAGADVQQFEYNAAGSRSATTVNGVRTEYLVAPDVGGTVLAEYDVSGGLLAHNVYAPTLVGRTAGAGGAVNYFDFDIVGSTAGVTDAAGAYVNRYAYDPFGTVLLGSESVANPFKFVGQLGVRGEIGGLSQMGLRDYAAQHGHFNSVDPLRLSADVNTYRYAKNSPVMNVDPLGLFFVAIKPFAQRIMALDKPLVTAETSMFGDLVFSVGVDGWQGLAIAAQTGKLPSAQDAGWGVLSSFALNAGFAYPGVGGFASAFQVAMDPEVNQHFVSAACGLAYQREFGTLNRSAAKQLAALEAESGGAGGGTVNAACLDGFPQSSDADMGIGDRCAYGETSIPFALDPNDKLAPAGIGPENFVRVDQPIEYAINFENLGPGSVDAHGNPYPIVATAAARRIAVSDRLSAHFDWSTVRFTEFAFGDTVIHVVQGEGEGAYYASVPALSAGNVPFLVQIIAEVDLETGILSVVLQALDPSTGLPPASLAGVLPPEDGTGRGKGHFRFSVKALPTAAHGTPVRNVALVRFDQNDVIATNQVNPLDPAAGTDPAREALVTLWDGRPLIVGRHAFYNNSALDGDDPAAGTRDDDAIANDKVALLPGQTATAANVTNYWRGVNGVMLDVIALPGEDSTADDFLIEVSRDGATWSPGPTPAVSVRRSAAAYGADRLTLTLPDGAARDTWVRVTVAAGPRTGLTAPDVFYFGNLVGETGDSAVGGRLAVSAIDLLRTRRAMSSASPADSRYDFNRDGRVSPLDLAIVRSAVVQRRSLSLLKDAPAPAPVAPTPGISRAGLPADDDDDGLLA